MIDDGLLLVLVGFFGLMIGSFLNAAIYRLPRACLSLIRHVRSRCPRCGVELAWYDNIPVFSYVVLLRGRCRGCGVSISLRYPLVELATSALFIGLALHDGVVAGDVFGDGAGARWAVWAVHAFLGSALIVLSLIDFDYRILPDAMTLPGIAITPLLVFLVPSVLPGAIWEPFDGEWGVRLNALVNGLMGAAVGGASLWCIGWAGSRVFKKPAMGLGDVKLLAAMGGCLGIWLFLALILACFGGALIGVAVLLVRRDRYVPFGPFLALGMMITLLWGPAIWEWLLLPR